MKKIKHSSRRVASDEVAGSPELPEMSDRSKQIARVAQSIAGFQLWSTVEGIRAMKTRITSMNRALCCGGVPGGMLGLIHGPSQGGKTLLLAEIIYDAWATGGWGLFIDAECRAVDLKWFRAICGRIEEIMYFKPATFEDAIAKVQELREKWRVAKQKKEVPEEAFLAIGVDSVNRLTPRNELKELLEGRKVEARGYPLRALLTSKWLDKLIPTLARDEVIVFILREGKKMEAMPGQRQWTVKGGSAPVYDAGWECRVTATLRQRAGDDKEGVLCGEKHEVEVIKNSLGPHLNEVAHFYSATGAEPTMPIGLDFSREVRAESLSSGLVTYKSGTGYLMGEDVLAPNKKDYLLWLQAETDGELNWRRIARKLDENLERKIG